MRWKNTEPYGSLRRQAGQARTQNPNAVQPGVDFFWDSREAHFRVLRLERDVPPSPNRFPPHAAASLAHQPFSKNLLNITHSSAGGCKYSAAETHARGAPLVCGLGPSAHLNG